jgi:hypothetical protein
MLLNAEGLRRVISDIVCAPTYLCLLPRLELRQGRSGNVRGMIADENSEPLCSSRKNGVRETVGEL